MLATDHPTGNHHCSLCVEVSLPSLVAHRDFAVLPSLGGIVPGHILLVPKRHVRRWLALPAEEARQGDRLMKQLSRRLSSSFGAGVHFFEHGSGTHAETPACSIEHAHIHAIPTDKQVRERLRQDYPWQPVGGWQRVQQLAGDSEYLWYQTPEGDRSVCVTLGGFPSQYLRRVFTEELGGTRWNWREFPNSSNMTQTVLGFAASRPHT
jgi:diadenosine tetraphosphate (Ap4A) HIT family hydrolase